MPMVTSSKQPQHADPCMASAFLSITTRMHTQMDCKSETRQPHTIHGMKFLKIPTSMTFHALNNFRKLRGSSPEPEAWRNDGGDDSASEEEMRRYKR